MLSMSLIKRLRLDLTTNADEVKEAEEVEDREEDLRHTEVTCSRRWIALPKVLRLSTRPRPPLNPDGTRSRTFARASKSGTMPSFVFSLTRDIEILSERLVEDALMPLFRKLHPEKSGWNLSLVNLCATNMSLTANETKDGAGRDISMMFQRQEDFLRDWKVEDIDISPEERAHQEHSTTFDTIDDCTFAIDLGRPQNTNAGSEDFLPLTEATSDDGQTWDSGEDEAGAGDACKVCGAIMPPFAVTAHERFHTVLD